ncbi:MAG: zinc ribbon domain-containing protein [Chloroflexi bacterium]|nr:zinc ribbon domain-containing protein [Chloroflexota bacterium]
MEYILIALVVVITLAVIAYPLFTAPRAKLSAPENALDPLLAQRDATYDAIRDLDFDYSLGKLSQTDYATLRDKYRTRAAQLLQQIDAASSRNGEQLDAQIEAQVAQMRRAKEDVIESEVARLRAKKQSAVEKPVAPTRAAKAEPALGFCGKCGTPRRAGDKFCSKCGAKL